MNELPWESWGQWAEDADSDTANPSETVFLMSTDVAETILDAKKRNAKKNGNGKS
jgi:hypothetical protein